MLFYYLFVFYLLYGTFADMTTLPVFLLDNDNVLPDPIDPVNPFSTLPQPDFMELMKQVRRHSSSVIIFVENELCTEDISAKDKLGTPFYHLHKRLTEQKVRYFPSISQPYELLNQIFRPQGNKVFYLKAKTTKLPIYDNRFKYIYVFFEDHVNETRVDALRRHDLIMNEVYQVIKQFHQGPVTALYTGRTNPMKHMLRHALVSTSDSHTKKFVTKHAMITVSGVTLLRAGRRWPLTDKMSLEIENFTDFGAERVLLVAFQITNFVLHFVFKIDDTKRWIFRHISWYEFEQKKKVLVGREHIKTLGAPWNVSLACDVPIHVTNKRDNSIVIIPIYQIEVVKEWFDDDTIAKDTKNRRKFSRVFHCQPFFNPTIVTGLFVSFICLGVLLFGVVVMMNCKPNDRYEDPHSRVILRFEGLD